METSSLENIGQKKLYTILYFAKQHLDGDKISHNSMEEDDVMEAFDSAVRLVVQTQRRELEYIDTNFVEDGKEDLIFLKPGNVKIEVALFTYITSILKGFGLIEM